MAMIQCPECGNQVSQGAATCPSCGYELKPKKKKGKGCLITVVVVIAIIILASALAGGGDKEAKKADSSTSKTESKDDKKDEKTIFGVGETADLNGVQMTLVSAEENAGSEYNKPADGKVFMICTYEINNGSDSEINVSSMMSMEAYVDGYATQTSLTAQMETDTPSLDGTVGAGKNMNGVICYEIPSDWKELEMTFTPDFWSSKEITFKATK